MTDDPAATDGRTAIATFDHETVRSASRLVITALALVFLLYLVTLLPGVDRLVPATPVSVAALATAIVSVAVAGLVLSVAPKLATLTRVAAERVGPGTSPTRDPVAENAAGIAYWLAVLAAVIVVHRGFAGAVPPLLGGLTWTYDAAFLFAALVPVVFVTARLAATVDPLSTRIADRVAEDGENGERSDETDRDG
ncbi:hypothetical protein [Halorubrum sp. DTA98]|uniref:hypothetical protein n=1 Tax=Halorubrum sp. DTA98 TaxID=3402163 RepID=UPI003AAF0321